MLSTCIIASSHPSRAYSLLLPALVYSKELGFALGFAQDTPTVVFVQRRTYTHKHVIFIIELFERLSCSVVTLM